MYLEYVSILLRPYRISFLKLQIPASFRDQTSPALCPAAVWQFGCQGSRTITLGTFKGRPVQGNAFPAGCVTGAAQGPQARVPELPRGLQLTLD